MRALIAVLPGDGAGPEVTEQAVRVLELVARAAKHDFELRTARIGGAALAHDGCALPPATRALCERADATLVGTVGGPADAANPEERSEDGLFELRSHLGLFANLRPVKPMPELARNSSIKPDVRETVDMIFVREVTGGIYSNRRYQEADLAVDECAYTADEIRRVVRVACEIARRRRRRVTSIDNATVLATSRLWRATTERLVAEEYPDISLDHMLVDDAALRLIEHPSTFDVIVADNMFGDILSDVASVLTGAPGNLASASVGGGRPGLFEPAHGFAPDSDGNGVANPFGAILSAAMLLRQSLGLRAEAGAVETAVAATIRDGIATADVAPPGRAATSGEVGSAVLQHLELALAPRSPRVTRSIRW